MGSTHFPDFNSLTACLTSVWTTIVLTCNKPDLTKTILYCLILFQLILYIPFPKSMLEFITVCSHDIIGICKMIA